MQSEPSAGHAVAELMEILRAAESAFDHPESLEGALVRVSSAAAQMELFELRFGLERDRAPGWDGVRAAATRLLERADGAGERGPYFNRDSVEVAAIESNAGAAGG